jgi:hypothetical protein
MVGMWNTLRVDISLEDLLARPEPGGGDFSYDAARAKVQRALDADPMLGLVAEQWRADAERVRAGSLVWTVYEYDGDPWPAARAVIEASLERFREAGVKIAVANPAPR